MHIDFNTIGSILGYVSLGYNLFGHGRWKTTIPMILQQLGQLQSSDQQQQNHIVSIAQQLPPTTSSNSNSKGV